MRFPPPHLFGGGRLYHLYTVPLLIFSIVIRPASAHSPPRTAPAPYPSFRQNPTRSIPKTRALVHPAVARCPSNVRKLLNRSESSSSVSRCTPSRMALTTTSFSLMDDGMSCPRGLRTYWPRHNLGADGGVLRHRASLAPFLRDRSVRRSPGRVGSVSC